MQQERMLMRRVFLVLFGCAFAASLALMRLPVAAAATAQLARLILIDDPEIIPVSPAQGVLYDGILRTSATRVYVFESLQPTKPPRPDPPPRRLRVIFTNVSRAPVEFNVLGGARGPNGQPTTVGQITLGCYFVYRYRHAPTSYHLGPGETIGIMDFLLKGSGSTVSGIFDVAGVPPGSLRVRAVVTAPADASPLGVSAQFTEVSPWRSGVFDLTSVRTQTVAVDATRTPAPAPVPFATLGDDCHPLPSVNDGRRRPVVGPPGGYRCSPVRNAAGYYDLHGDYGVLRTYLVRITNDSPADGEVALYVRPRGGDVFGTFVLDQAIVQIAGVPTVAGATGTAGLYEVTAIPVAARSTRTVTLSTMGQGEAAYPAELFLMRRMNGIPAARRPADGMAGALANLSDRCNIH